MGNKTKLQMRTDLATDLKITIATEMSATELNRCIDRAYSDLNRFLPDEKIFEDSNQFAVADESVTFPADTDLDAVVADEDLQAAAAGSTAPLDGQPDVPRPLTVTITDSNLSINGMVITIKGTDKDDQGVQETYSYIRGDSKTIVGKKYFKNVLRVDFIQLSGGGPGDLLDIGYETYTDVWVDLANSPIKWQSDSGVGDDDVAIVRNTDYYIDYANGRVKAISGGLIAKDEVCEFTYKKSPIGIDISNLPGLIRVQRVEYPVGDIPQTFVTGDTFGKYFVVTGMGESEDQGMMAEDKQYRIYYDAEHHSPGEYSPGTEPGFLTGTVELAANAYALYILALKQEHQAVTDLTAARTSLTAANSFHTQLQTALTNMKKYLDNNSEIDAAGIIKNIGDDVAELRTKIITAADLINDLVDGADTDLGSATTARDNYMGTTNYVDGDTAPDIKKYLDDGDALLNEVAKGGEGQEVPRAYAEYAKIVKDALVAAHEQDRAFYQQNATARTNAAMAAANEVAQRLSHLRTYLEETAGYVAISNSFGTIAEHRATDIVTMLQQAAQYVNAAGADMSSADRFKAEADERRNEVYSIWRDRKQYIGDFTGSSVRQMPDYK